MLDAIDTLEQQNERAMDLVRYQRGELHTANLITDEEYAALVQIDGAVQRLEGYDIVRQKIAALEADTARLDWLADKCRGNVRGTDYQEWSIQGEEHADLRDSIDAARKEGKP